VLNLNTNLLNKILNSAQTTTARILRADAKVPLEYIHLLVLAPSNRASKRQTWGFFSVERLKDTKEGAVANDHAIEIYLYMEGNDVQVRGNK
jgi:hypothetical protein